MITVFIHNHTNALLYTATHNPQDSFTNVAKKIVAQLNRRANSFVFLVRGKNDTEDVYAIAPADMGIDQDPFKISSTGIINDVTFDFLQQQVWYCSQQRKAWKSTAPSDIQCLPDVLILHTTK